ncbi:hypothetical protein CANARDRAFT_27925 [[Candida] arabinofermentans NRRL YB-2248]|uniref:Uncharacterized protein n=1 Tax=[Candida] arabinofermentans NRRL YB-2248 TaxID=983967 RepID=A0A1E4T265_9ASCO|nr:hypothetical protein CANARDRAFT_27925 [[Candida] arabinofermentans NRRL YB-2248]
MPPRASANRNRKGKNPPKKKNNNFQQHALQSDLSSNPSDTLQTIINDLDLSYDSSLGTLQGDAMFSRPLDYKLLAVKKLLEKLISEVEKGIKVDSDLLIKIDSDLKLVGKQQLDDNTSSQSGSTVSGLKDDSLAGLNSSTKDRKRVRDESDDDDIDTNRKSNAQTSTGAANHDTISARKDKTINIDDDEDDNFTGGGEGDDTNGAGDDDHDDDDDDDDEYGTVRPPKTKRRRIIIKTNGERKEITPDFERLNGGKNDTKIKIEHPSKRALDSDDDGEGGSDIEIQSVKRENNGKGTDRFVPSVYEGKEDITFPIEEILKPVEEALNLYDDELNKKTAKSDHEYLKRKYAVEVYPEHDLKDLLPGEIPMTDFSTAKPVTNQIAFTSFQAYTDPFFRNFNDEDLKLLKTKCILSSNLPKDYNEKVTPYEIPKLGALYSDVWYEDDIKSGLIKPDQGTPNFSAKEQMVLNMKNLVEPKGSSSDITNDVLETEYISCGPLTSRLLSALIKDETEDGSGANVGGNSVDLTDDDVVEGTTIAAESSSSSSALADQQGWKSSFINTDYKTLDERLKRELKYIGVFMNVEQTLNDPNFNQDWMESKEDDEISNELRKLQQELKKVQACNIKRKKKLVPLVEEQIAWQEYLSILEDLDKQVEQHYRRRINVTPKKSKKRGPGAHHHHANNKTSNGGDKDDSQHLVTSSSFKSLLEKRSKWITKIGPLFKSQLEMRRMPKESIFKDLNLSENMNDGDEDQEDQEDQEDVDVLGNNNNENGGAPQSENLGDIE